MLCASAGRGGRREKAAGKTYQKGMLQKLICNILFVYMDIGFYKGMSNIEYREKRKPRGGLEGPQPLQV